MKTVFASSAALILLAACQSTARADLAETKPDPRQGEQVRQICFNSQIRGWRENDRRSVIVEKGVRDEYKLELVGACQPESAFTSIGLISRFGVGSCLSEGDRLVTDDRFAGGSCSITRIYKWNKDAASPDAEAESATPTEK